MSNRAWSGYLALTLAAVAGYFWVPDDTWAETVYAELVGLVATGAIVVGVVRYRPAAQVAWWWFAAGQLLNVLGTLAVFAASAIHSRGRRQARARVAGT